MSTTDVSPQVATTPPRTGGRMVALGAMLVVLGLGIYGVQFFLGHFTVPWYAPALATLGTLVGALALARRATLVRALVVALCGAMAAIQWWYITSFSVLPVYTAAGVGQPFPAFVAARADGAPFTEADLAGERGTLLVLFRGRWCPYCMTQLGGLQSHGDEFALRGVQVVVASLETTAEAQLTQQEHPSLVVLSDEARQLATATSAIHPQSKPDGSDTAAPTMFVIDAQGRIRWLFRPTRYIERPAIDTVLAAIDEHLTSDP